MTPWCVARQQTTASILVQCLCNPAPVSYYYVNYPLCFTVAVKFTPRCSSDSTCQPQTTTSPCVCVRVCVNSFRNNTSLFYLLHVYIFTFSLMSTLYSMSLSAARPLVCEDIQADVEDGQLQFFYILAFILQGDISITRRRLAEADLLSPAFLCLVPASFSTCSLVSRNIAPQDATCRRS